VTPVRYVNLQRAAERYEAELLRVLGTVVRSGTYIGGAELARFEAEFAAFCGVRHAVGVANGLEALELTLRAWGIGPGDEVIVPANTAIPTALAVTHAGAEVVLADVEDDTGLIDLASVEAHVMPKTRAVIPVHLYGHPCDMTALRVLAERHGLLILEDAAHAHGALFEGRRCGALADAGAFSFYPTKNLGAFGDGGCVTTGDNALAARIRSLRNLGLTTNYQHEVRGFNSRLDPLQAAVLRWKLPHMDAWNARRRDLAALYLRELDDVNGVTPPTVRPWAKPVWHAFPVRVHDGFRDDVESALREAGIETNVHYRVPIHLQGAYVGRWARGAFPVSERRALELLSLPLDAFHTDDEVKRVVAVLRASLYAARARRPRG